MKIARYESVTKDGCFNISPSSLHTWFDNPLKWYKDNILKQSNFHGNTSSVFGTIMHSVAENVFHSQSLTAEDVIEYLEDYTDNIEVNKWYIIDEFMAHKVIFEEFLTTRPKPDYVEHKTIFEPIQGFTIGGTVDAVSGTKVTDYKTVSSFSSEIKVQHKYQLVLYALSLIANGIHIDTIEIVQIKRGDSKGKVSEKTGKTIGIVKPEIRVLEEKITPELIEMVKDDIKVLIDTLKVYTDNKDLARVLFRDNKTSYTR